MGVLEDVHPESERETVVLPRVDVRLGVGDLETSSVT